MADYRPIKIVMWHDNWFLTLNPEEKLLWIFLLTNEYVHISGIYELPKTLISPLTGITDPLPLLTKFEKDKKIVIKNGFIFIRNYLRHQSKNFNKTDNVIKNIIAYFSENPQLIELFNLEKETPYKTLISPLQDPSLKRKKEKGKRKNLNISLNQRETSSPEEKDVNEIIEFFKNINPSYRNFYSNKTQRGALLRLLKIMTKEELINGIKFLPEIVKQPYAPRITTPLELENKLGALKIFIEQQKNNLKIIKI